MFSSKSMVALSAMFSAAVVAAIVVAGPSAAEPSAATQISQRFPAANEMFAPMSVSSFAAQKAEPAIEGKNDRMPLSDTCAREDWPYLSQQCLISADGGPVRKVQRVITIERRIGESTSELARLPVADLAQR